MILEDKWATVYGNTEQEVKSRNTLVKHIDEVFLKDFQYKINNKILVTNSFLHRIKN